MFTAPSDGSPSSRSQLVARSEIAEINARSSGLQFIIVGCSHCRRIQSGIPPLNLKQLLQPMATSAQRGGAFWSC